MEKPKRRLVTVSQVNDYIKRILDNNTALGDIWVRGEISNYKRHSSGHLYITLKDKGGVLKAVMFKSAAAALTFEPEDGMEVIAHGRVSVYEAGGVYQLYIEDMQREGVGRLYEEYEKLKKQLAAEGLFDEPKKTIPRFPRAIGVATATTGAAVKDIINVVTRRYPAAKIIIYPTLVQGAGAKESIKNAIEYFNREQNVDTLIVGRGGGSIEDLWAFNEEIVARAIYASQIPVISAVGHETDFTIADFVADLRAPTPSVAAERAVPDSHELKAGLDVTLTRLESAMGKKIESGRLVLKRFRMRTPKDKIEEYYLRLDGFSKRMEHALAMKTSENKKSLTAAASKLDALSPLKTLTRGYAIPVRGDGSVIRGVADVKSGDEFSLRLRDGARDCIVK